MDEAGHGDFSTERESKAKLTDLNHWRFCDELTVAEAAALYLGFEPNSGMGSDSPVFKTLVTAMSRAVWSGTLAAGDPEQFTSYATLLKVTDIKAWFELRGVNSGFFFPEPPPSLGYLDPSHDRYPRKLAAAVHAWLAVGDEPLKAKTPKAALTKWLNEHAGHFGLTDDTGVPKKNTVDDIAKVANWEEEGGAPKSSG